MDSNHRPHPYQGCALTSWATGPLFKENQPLLKWLKVQSTYKRVTRIELATTAWKAVVLPLNYTRIWWTLQDSNLRPVGYEPTALTSWAKGPTSFKVNSGGGDRTHDLTGMNRTLSPAELRRHVIGKTGFEPTTPWSQTKCSTKLSYFPVIF